MLTNVHDASTMRGLARARRRVFLTKSVHPKLVDEEETNGWQVERASKRSVRLRKPKAHATLLEDRVWSLLYRMGFGYLSGSGGAQLAVNRKDPATPKSQIDVVAIDPEIALGIECKSAERPSKRPTFQEELGKHSLVRERLGRAVADQFPTSTRRPVVLLIVTSNVLLSDNDRKRAADARVLLFDQQDLEYYEALVGHVVLQRDFLG